MQSFTANIQITLGNTQFVAFKERLVFSQFKCAESKSEASLFLQATDLQGAPKV